MNTAATSFPQNGKESLLFLAVISLLSVNTIGPLIMGFELGFSKEVYLNGLKILPFIWMAIILLVPFVVGPLASKATAKFIAPTDSGNARILFTILFTVTFLSIIMTIVGSWIGMKQISMAPIEAFFQKWPRNFFIAFWVELLFAHPIARWMMRKIHAAQQQKLQGTSA